MNFLIKKILCCRVLVGWLMCDLETDQTLLQHSLTPGLTSPAQHQHVTVTP